MPYLRTLPDGTLLLRLYVQPRASSNMFAGVHDGALKIRLTTPPVEGRANKAIIAFLAKQLNVPKSALTIKSGHRGREKQVLISGCDERNARRILNENAGST
jgi:hypothetical protein